MVLMPFLQDKVGGCGALASLVWSMPPPYGILEGGTGNGRGLGGRAGWLAHVLA